MSEDTEQSPKKEDQQIEPEPKDYSADIDYWATQDYWPIIDIPWLVLGFDPDKIAGDYDFALNPEDEETKCIINRILDRERGRLADPTRTQPRDAIWRLKRYGFEFPAELVEAVKAHNERVELLSQAGETQAPKSGTSSAETRKVRTLRRLLLAIAVDKFRYNPNLKTEAVAKIVNCAAERGITVHPDSHP
jgi:hypothetical protein